MALIDDILGRKVRSCVMGLGYVGLPLALEFVRAGYQVVGLDSNPDRVAQLRRGESYVTDIPDNEIAEAFDTGHFDVTTDPAIISEVQTINICVPTPLNKSGNPDLSYVQSALESIEKYKNPGQLYILPSVR